LYIPTSGFSPCRAGVDDTLQFLHKIRTIETNAFAQVPESEMQGGPEQGPLHKKYFFEIYEERKQWRKAQLAVHTDRKKKSCSSELDEDNDSLVRRKSHSARSQDCFPSLSSLSG